MVQEYLNVIIQVSVFMICARMILHLRIKASGEKYIKGIVGLMVVAFMVTSVVTKWNENLTDGIFPDANEMETRIEEMMRREMKMGNISDNYVQKVKEKMAMDAIGNLREISVNVENTPVVLGECRD